jgi:hypothetical protein
MANVTVRIQNLGGGLFFVRARKGRKLLEGGGIATGYDYNEKQRTLTAGKDVFKNVEKVEMR